MQEKRRYRPGNEMDTPGQRIRFLRKALGLSQAALAAQIFSSQPAVSQWENDLWVPTRMAQALLAEKLHTTRDFLFGELAA